MHIENKRLDRKHINFIGTGILTIMKKYRKQRICKDDGKNNYDLIPKEQIILYKNKVEYSEE